MAGGLGSILLSTALSGVGSLLTNQSNNDAAKRQQNILRNAQIEAERKNKQKNDLVQNFTADTYNPIKRLQSYETAADTGQASLLDSIKKANGDSLGQVPASAQGRLSEDYTKGLDASNTAAGADITDRARLLSRVGAGSNIFMNEGMKNNELNSNVATIDSSINNGLNAAQTAANNVRNKGSLIGGLLTGAAGASSGIYDALKKKNG